MTPAIICAWKNRVSCSVVKILRERFVTGAAGRAFCDWYVLFCSIPRLFSPLENDARHYTLKYNVLPRTQFWPEKYDSEFNLINCSLHYLISEISLHEKSEKSTKRWRARRPGAAITKKSVKIFTKLTLRFWWHKMLSDAIKCKIWKMNASINRNKDW